MVEEMAVVEAFFEAAAGGDMGRLVALLAPGAVRSVDPRLLPPGAPTVVRGAGPIAEETRYFGDRIAVAVPVLVDGMPGAVIAPGGHPFALIRFRIDSGLVTEFSIEPYAVADSEPNRATASALGEFGSAW
ncbi:hypothetical protein [Cryptosporangium sp. NPDC048952]|uniref:hypothetical protein n=1 Tax=Cryptosporangium sp. NPDC048952 TaxID=3363961 RepID=UPI00371C9DE4